MKRSYYTEKIRQVSCQRIEKEHKLKQLGTYRVLSFLIMVAGLIAGVKEGATSALLLGVGMLILFVILVRKYHALQQALAYDVAREAVLNRYNQRLDDGNSGWKSFKENGSAYLETVDNKAKDLDLIGRSSLYQFLSVCHTPLGKRKLVQALTEGSQSREEILKRQEAVKELIENETLCLHLQTLSFQMAAQDEKLEEEEKLLAFIEEAEKKQCYVGKGMKALSYGLPFITLFAIISLISKRYVTPAYIIAAVGILTQLMIAFYQYGRSQQLLGTVYVFTQKIAPYRAFLDVLEKEKFKSDYLKALQRQLLQSGGAMKGLSELKTLAIAIDVRYNGILYLVAAGLLMWDTHCKHGLEKWHQHYGKEVRGWLEVVGDFEELMSLAVMGQVKSRYCIPKVEAAQVPVIAFKGLTHPLIEEEKAVGNSFSLQSSTCIITGSNMSGKTTFLRSMGVALSLTYAGGVVPADSFTASCMHYLTSMRVEDRVDLGISTFYAEILRIKEMVQYSKAHRPMLVLIDEIFKGTNSADRILGAQETIKRLSEPWANVIVSTHDFELCRLEAAPGRTVVNYHFEEHYRNDQILFDYRLKEGRSQTTNAKFLLRMAGIIV